MRAAVFLRDKEIGPDLCCIKLLLLTLLFLLMLLWCCGCDVVELTLRPVDIFKKWYAFRAGMGLSPGP